MTNDIPQEGKFWVVIGKLSIIVFLIGGIWQIYEKFSTPSTKLEAIANWSSYATEPSFDDFIAKLYDVTSQKHLVAIFNEKITPLLGQELDSDSAERLSRVIQYSFDDARRAVKLAGGYWTVTITNPGELIVKGTTLRVPSAGMARVTSNGTTTIKRNTPEIAVGDIAPGGRANVEAWVDSTFRSNADFENVTLYHNDGRVQINFPEKKGFFSYVFEDQFSTAVALILFLIFLSVIFMLGFSLGEKSPAVQLEDPKPERKTL